MRGMTTLGADGFIDKYNIFKVSFKMSHDDLKRNLIRIIRERSYREGDFTLSSGQKSKFYIDLKNTTLFPAGADLIGRLTVPYLRDGVIKAGAVGGLTLGADPIVTAVSLRAFDFGIELPAVIVRKESKSHGTQQFLEGAERLAPKTKFLVVEDVTTTGASAIAACERIEAAGHAVEAILTVVDREQGAAAVFEERGYRFFALTTLTEISAAN